MTVESHLRSGEYEVLLDALEAKLVEALNCYKSREQIDEADEETKEEMREAKVQEIVECLEQAHGLAECARSRYWEELVAWERRNL